MIAVRRSTVLADAIARRSRDARVDADPLVRVGLSEQKAFLGFAGAVTGAILVGVGAAWALDLRVTRADTTVLGVFALLGGIVGGVVGASHGD